MIKKTFLFLIATGFINTTFGMESLSVLNIDNLAFTSLQDFIQTKTKLLEKKHHLALDLALGKKLNIAPTNVHLLFAYGNQLKAFKQMVKKRLIKAEQTHYDVLSSVLKKEQEAHKQNHYVLYHSTKAHLYAMHYIDTQLYALEQELLYNNIIPTDTLLKLRQGISSIPDAEHAKQRNHFINNGTYNDAVDQEFLLSCNFALTGNINRSGSCTIDYWMRAGSAWPPCIKLDTIMQSYSGALLESIKQRTQALKQAIKTFNTQCKTGVLLQLIFKSPILIQECIYLSYPGGPKRTPCIKSDLPYLLEETSKNSSETLFILNALRNNPAIVQDIDELQFRVVLTKDKLLNIANPDIYNNFEIYAYCSPMDALETFKQEVNGIIQQIKNDYATYNTAYHKVKRLAYLTQKKLNSSLDTVSSYIEYYEITPYKVLLGGIAGTACMFTIAGSAILAVAIKYNIHPLTFLSKCLFSSTHAAWRSKVLSFVAFGTAIGTTMPAIAPTLFYD